MDVSLLLFVKLHKFGIVLSTLRENAFFDDSNEIERLCHKRVYGLSMSTRRNYIIIA